MKRLSVILVLMGLYVGNPTIALSETVASDELVRRGDLYYKKFTNTPFSGKVKSKYYNGEYKNGQATGIWQYYHKNGQLYYLTPWKNGKAHGVIQYFFDNGQPAGQTSYKNGIKHGLKIDHWGLYGTGEGRLWFKYVYKDGERHGPTESYYENGQLEKKGQYKNGRVDGHWEVYNKDGTVDYYQTGTYKEGVRISANK